MNPFKTFLLAPVLLAVMTAAVSCMNVSSPGSDLFQPQVDEVPAPDFTLEDLDGKIVTLRDFLGGPVLINFWATWCPPCRAELPYIQELYEDKDWRERGLTVLAIDMGEQGEGVRDFLAENGFTFNVLLDKDEQVSKQYGVRAIPTTFVVDKDGIIKAGRLGAFTGKKQIEKMLEDSLK